MLDSLSLYSNFWCGWNKQYYYRRTAEYAPIRKAEVIGCHQVVLVNSCFLVDLRHAQSARLSFKPEKIQDYDGPVDDILSFAISANKNRMK